MRGHLLRCCSRFCLNFALGFVGISHLEGRLSILRLNLVWAIDSITNPHKLSTGFGRQRYPASGLESQWLFRMGNISMCKNQRRKGTELKGIGEYNKFYEDGLYKCAGCGTPLYKSTTKFDSGSGWPAFYEGLPGAINRNVDADGRRIEITCAACGGHLGHVFKGKGFQVPTHERHCVNSVSIKFIPEN